MCSLGKSVTVNMCPEVAANIWPTYNVFAFSLSYVPDTSCIFRVCILSIVEIVIINLVIDAFRTQENTFFVPDNMVACNIVAYSRVQVNTIEGIIRYSIIGKSVIVCRVEPNPHIIIWSHIAGEYILI